MKREVYLGKVIAEIEILEKIVQEERQRQKDYPKLTYEQLWDGILCRMINEAEALRRTHGIKRDFTE